MARRPITRPIFNDISARADKHIADEDAAFVGETHEAHEHDEAHLPEKTRAERHAGRHALKAHKKRTEGAN